MLLTRSLIVAGEAARMNHRLDEALELYTRASEVARRQDDRHAASWGRCLVALALEAECVEELVHDFELLKDKRPEDRSRLLTARELVARLRSGFASRRVDETVVGELLAMTTDPTVRTGWRNAHGYCLMVEGRYAEARAVLQLAMEDIEEFDLVFARPHVEWSLASVELGLRHIARCESLLRGVERSSAFSSDRHLQLNVRVLRARMYLAQQQPERALEIASAELGEPPSRAMHGEYLSTRGLALAVLGESARALVLAENARKVTEAVETQMLAAGIDAICAVDGPESRHACERLVVRATQLGAWDGVVCAVRASRRLLEELVGLHAFEPQLSDLLIRSNDSLLARGAGLRVAVALTSSTLSAREHEVLDLIGTGMTNKEIAAALFIGSSTVKSHVDNILVKLGARTRAEAVARYAESAAAAGSADMS